MQKYNAFDILELSTCSNFSFKIYRLHFLTFLLISYIIHSPYNFLRSFTSVWFISIMAERLQLLQIHSFLYITYWLWFQRYLVPLVYSLMMGMKNYGFVTAIKLILGTKKDVIRNTWTLKLRWPVCCYHIALNTNNWMFLQVSQYITNYLGCTNFKYFWSKLQITKALNCAIYSKHLFSKLFFCEL